MAPKIGLWLLQACAHTRHTRSHTHVYLHAHKYRWSHPLEEASLLAEVSNGLSNATSRNLYSDTRTKNTRICV